MLFALLYGHLVDALIVVDIAPVAYAHTFVRHVRAMQDIDFSRQITRSAVEGQLSRAVPDVAERRFLMQNLITTDGKLAWRINLPAIREFMDELTGFPPVDGLDYTGRCLFIAGGRSEYLRRDDHPTVLTLFPDAELAFVEDAGHRVHAEQRRRSVDAVLSFLAAVDREREKPRTNCFAVMNTLPRGGRGPWKTLRELHQPVANRSTTHFIFKSSWEYRSALSWASSFRTSPRSSSRWETRSSS